MRKFIPTVHYVAMTAGDVARALGATMDIVNDEGSLQYELTADIDGEVYRFGLERMDGEPTNTLISLMPGHFETALHTKILDVFGDTSVPAEIVARITDEITVRGLVTTQRVLIAGHGDVVASMIGHTSSFPCLALSAELAGTPTPVLLDTLEDTVKGVESLPSTGVDLIAWEYATLVDRDLVEDSTSTILGLSDHMVEDVLRQSAIGRVHVYGYLSGPLRVSQASIQGDGSWRQQAGPGFIGQFIAAGSDNAYLHMVANDNGTVTRESAAL